MRVVADLNRRFESGAPDKHFARAGVLLSAIDGTQVPIFSSSLAGVSKPWLHTQPSSRVRAYASSADRVTASLASRRLPFMYGGDSWGRGRWPGFIISPEIAQAAALCAYEVDADSTRFRCPRGTANGTTAGSARSCLPGCMGATLQSLNKSHWCSSPRPARTAHAFPVGPLGRHPGGGRCPWAPSELDRMLELHERRVHDCGGANCCDCCTYPKCTLYNEVLLSAAVWEERLPATVEAIFLRAGSDRHVLAYARRMHAAFNAAFPRSDPVPLVQVDLSAPAARGAPAFQLMHNS